MAFGEPITVVGADGFVMEKYAVPSPQIETENKPEKKLRLEVLFEKVKENVLATDLVELKRNLPPTHGGVYPNETKRKLDEGRHVTSSLNEEIASKSNLMLENVNTLVKTIESLRESNTPSEIINSLVEQLGSMKELIALNKNASEELATESKKTNNQANTLISEALVDKKTNVATIDGLIESNLARLKWVMENGAWDELNNTEILYIDMMLFHKGNEVLGMGGFDELVKKLIQGTKAMSRYLATDYHGLYRPFTPGEEKTDKDLNRYFPDGSDARAALDALKESGVEIIPARVNAGGGDEFAFQINFTKGKTKELSEDSRSIIDRVIKNTVISKDRTTALPGDGYELTENDKTERRKYWDLFTERLNDFMVNVDPKLGIDEEKVQTYRKFVLFVRSYFMSRKEEFIGEQGKFFDPQVDTRMDYALVERGGGIPSLSEIEEMAAGDQLVGAEDSKTFEDYVDGLMKGMARSMEVSELRNKDGLIQEARDRFLKDMSKIFFTKLDDEVGSRGKRTKKMNVIMSALKGNVQQLFLVGSQEKARPFLPSFDQVQRIEIIEHLMRWFSEEHGRVKQDGTNPKLVEQYEKYQLGPKIYYEQRAQPRNEI